MTGQVRFIGLDVRAAMFRSDSDCGSTQTTRTRRPRKDRTRHRKTVNPSRKRAFEGLYYSLLVLHPKFQGITSNGPSCLPQELTPYSRRYRRQIRRPVYEHDDQAHDHGRLAVRHFSWAIGVFVGLEILKCRLHESFQMFEGVER